MKALKGKYTFVGYWDEDLDRTISVFDALSNMFQISVTDRWKEMHIILSGAALKCFLPSPRIANRIMNL